MEQDALAARRLTLFTFLLAGAIVFHQSKLGDWELLSPHAVVTATALWTMLRPSDTRRLLVLLGVHFVSIVIDLPFVVNHWLLMGMAELGLFVALAYGRLRGARWAHDRGALHRALEPYLRLQVVLIYFFAALAKVNSGFFDNDLSCGVAMVDELFAHAPVKPGGTLVEESAIWGTILIELALPFLLSMRRTRLAGIFVGGGFHIILALSGHLPFSGFALAFYALFVPEDLPSRWDLVRAAQPRLDRVWQAVIRFGHTPVGYLVPAAFLVMAALATYVDSRVETAGYGLAFLVYLALNLLAGAALLACLWGDWRPGFAPAPLRPASPIWLIGPALVFLNGLTPYVGLKTQNSWTMYSNLQTEPGRWNHSLIPEDVRIFDMQDERVRIVSSSDEDLQEAADRGWEWSMWALRQKAQRDDQEFSVVYEQDGRRVESSSYALMAEDINPVAAKVWMMRDVPAAEDNGCRVLRNSTSNQGS